MSHDSYQAIYDAVRSRIHGGNVADAVAEVARQMFDISHHAGVVAYQYQLAAEMQQRPSVLMRPRVFPDGEQWCALYGGNLQDGVCGFGETPELAAQDFDRMWNTQKIQRPRMSPDGGKDIPL